MNYFMIFAIIFFIALGVAWLWIGGIDEMQKKHPDYKGDDFLNWGDRDIDDEFSRQNKRNESNKKRK